MITYLFVASAVLFSGVITGIEGWIKRGPLPGVYYLIVVVLSVLWPLVVLHGIVRFFTGDKYVPSGIDIIDKVFL